MLRLLAIKKRIKWPQWIFCCLLWCPIDGFTSDVEIEKATRHLKHLNQEIHQLKTEVSRESNKKKQLTTVLNRHQQQLNTLYHQIGDLQTRYRQHSVQHAGLQTRYHSQNAQLQLSYDELKTLLRTVYCLSYCHDQAVLQAYCYHLYQSQKNKVTQLHQQLEVLYQKLHQIEKHKKAAQYSLTQQERNHLQLKRKIRQYNEELGQSQTRLAFRQTRLQQLFKDKAALDKLIVGLTQSTRRQDADSLLHNHKGQLPWPIQGKLTRHYGELIERSELQSTGVFIAVAPQQFVKSVATGKVVFADQLRGLGALIVIEHGPGDLSLYGHNAHLLKKKGDRVQAKESIAVTTSYKANNGIYFELRLAGKAIDPEIWCIKRPGI